MGRNLDAATWAIAMLVLGLAISIIAAVIAEGTVSTVLFAVGLLLLLGGMVVLESTPRR